jgi:hypothetical protein
VSAAFLIPHILAGLTALASGALVTVSRKGTRWHVRSGAVYFWALAGLVATAAGLTAVRGPRDLPVFGLGVLALALASAGRGARRHPGALPRLSRNVAGQRARHGIGTPQDQAACPRCTPPRTAST